MQSIMSVKDHKRRWLGLFVVLWLGTSTILSAGLPSRRSNLSREPGAIYFEDFLDKPVKMRVLKQVPIYATAERRRALGTMKKGLDVQVVAMNEKQFRVRGRALHGDVAGWMLASELGSPDKNLVKNLRKMYERQLVVQELVAKNQVALGMTLDEVTQSMGKPSRKTTKLDKGGRSDVYEYATFERVPQTRFVPDRFGRIFRKTVWVKVETGTVSISFKDEVVQSIENKEGEPRGGRDVKIVPVPIELY